jgi:hypothetical protein
MLCQVQKITKKADDADDTRKKKCEGPVAKALIGILKHPGGWCNTAAVHWY